MGTYVNDEFNPHFAYSTGHVEQLKYKPRLNYLDVIPTADETVHLTLDIVCVPACVDGVLRFLAGNVVGIDMVEGATGKPELFISAPNGCFDGSRGENV